MPTRDIAAGTITAPVSLSSRRTSLQSQHAPTVKVSGLLSLNHNARPQSLPADRPSRMPLFPAGPHPFSEALRASRDQLGLLSLSHNAKHIVSFFRPLIPHILYSVSRLLGAAGRAARTRFGGSEDLRGRAGRPDNPAAAHAGALNVPHPSSRTCGLRPTT